MSIFGDNISSVLQIVLIYIVYLCTLHLVKNKFDVTAKASDIVRLAVKAVPAGTDLGAGANAKKQNFAGYILRPGAREPPNGRYDW